MNNKMFLSVLLFFLTSVLLSIPLLRLHPNENVYFNFLIGGLNGAREKNFPSWGNSYGNTYLQGIKWLNQNAEKNSKLALIQGTEANTPKILLRKDISLSNFHWSGFERKGEYLMELTFNDTGKAFHFTWEYVDKFLEPVYQIEVEGIPILKIWKNDLAHSKSELKDLKEVEYKGKIGKKLSGGQLIMEFGEAVDLSRVVLKFPLGSCQYISTGYLETSLDNLAWVFEKDPVTFTQLGNKTNFENLILNYYYPGRNAKFIRFPSSSDSSCDFSAPQVEVFHLTDE